MSSLLLAAAAAAGSPVPTVTVEQALANEKALVEAAVAKPKPKPCPQATGTEIVVCATQEDPATQYVPSDTDNGVPADDGIPRAPDVSGLPSEGMRIGKTPVHPLIIDLKSIPEPPAGSDADKIAKGEMAPP